MSHRRSTYPRHLYLHGHRVRTWGKKTPHSGKSCSSSCENYEQRISYPRAAWEHCPEVIYFLFYINNGGKKRLKMYLLHINNVLHCMPFPRSFHSIYSYFPDQKKKKNDVFIQTFLPVLFYYLVSSYAASRLHNAFTLVYVCNFVPLPTPVSIAKHNLIYLLTFSIKNQFTVNSLMYSLVMLPDCDIRLFYPRRIW